MYAIFTHDRTALDGSLVYSTLSTQYEGVVTIHRPADGNAPEIIFNPEIRKDHPLYVGLTKLLRNTPEIFASVYPKLTVTI